MKKTITLILLGLLCSVGCVWADTELFSTNFSDDAWSGITGICRAASTNADTTYNGITFHSTGSSPAKPFTIDQTKGTMTWCNNNMSNNFWIAIPVTGVNGSITITVDNGSTATRFKYALKPETSISGSPGSGTNNASSASDPATVTISDLDKSNYVVYLGRQGSGLTTVTSITITTPAPAKEISTQELSGVKVGGSALTLDAGTAGYSVDGTTITLTDDQQSATTPANVKLVNHIVYTDESTEDDDVDVSFDGTVTAGYYEGTATIDETDYTVRVKKDVTPTLALSSASASVTLKSYEAVRANGKNLDPVKVTLTGANLTNGEYDVSAEGLTISPASFTVADGDVNQEFSINTTSTTAASTDINFTVGELTETFTLNLTRPAKRSVSQSIVTEATTWDWANSSTEEILLTKNGSDEYTFDTDPVRGDEFLMAELPEVNNNASFNSQALMINTQYVKRTGDYFQGSSVKFKTNLSGQYSVIVQFSNTGNRSDTEANRRYLYIDGTNTGVYTLNTDVKTATATLTLDGTEKEIVINAYTGAATPAATMVRIYKIIITTVPVSVGSTGWATFCSDYALNFAGTGVNAYIVTGHSGSAITKSDALETVPANTPLLLNATAGNYSIPVIASSNTNVSGNLLVRGTGSGVGYAEGKTRYVLMAKNSTTAEFQLLADGGAPATVGTDKAYLQFNEAISLAPAALRLVDEENNATNIDAIEATEDAVKFIENGKLYIKKNNVVYDMMGTVIR